MSTVPEDEWTRDVAKMLVGWLLGSVLAIVLLMTVVKWAFV
jgi:hypothetical protein